MRRLVKFALPCAALVLYAAAAHAQPVPPGGGASSPPLSPYLGLLSGTGNPGLNYLGIVQPQMQLAQRFNQLNQQYNQASNTLSNLEAGSAPTFRYTGNVAVFNNTGPYFSRHPITGGNNALRRGFGGGGGFSAGGGGLGGAGQFNSLGGGGSSFGGGSAFGGGGSAFGGGGGFGGGANRGFGGAFGGGGANLSLPRR
jgi:hypothetical protein